MLKKLVEKRYLIFVIYVLLFIIFGTLTLIYREGVDRITVLVLVPIFFFVIYFFTKLLFKGIGNNASYEQMKFFIWFFLIGGLAITVSDIFGFITAFPDGLSPTFGGVAGVIKAILEEAKKFLETSDKK